MKLSQGEKLILLALAEARSGEKDLDLDFIRSAIYSGNSWALSWELNGIPAEDTDPKIADETAAIMSMWTWIEHCIRKLSKEDRDQLEKDVYPYGMVFEGFDGNHDKHFGVAQFMLDDMGRFDEFKGRSLNSHSQTTLPRYRKMIPVYERIMRGKGFSGSEFSAEELVQVLKP